MSLCLRFCNGNADCAAFGAGGGGPGSFCEGPVMCPTFLTAYHTCTFNCDPRAAAAAERRRLPDRARLPDAGGDGPGRLRLPRADAHEDGGRRAARRRPTARPA